MWKSPIFASSAAMQKSQEIISSNPPATACPSTTAIVGLERLNARSKVRAETWAILTELLVVPRNSESSMFRSAPAQNVLPRPRISTTRTSGSSSARSSAAPSWVSSAQLTQFLTSGRFSQMVATWSATSYWIGSAPVATAPLVAACAAMADCSSRFLELTSTQTVQGGRGDGKTRWTICTSAVGCAILKLIQLVAPILPIPLPLPHIKTVNAWLLHGDPLTLLDTGPHEERALAELERGLARVGVRVEDLELVLATHHHLDHVGLAAAIKRRSGARIAALGAVAAYAERYHDGVAADREFSRRLLARHGVPR